MSDILHRELDVPCGVDEAWVHVTDPTWLGEEGELDVVVGAEGWVRSDGDTRFLVVEEVDETRRLVYRWASFRDEPSRVEIELEPLPSGTRISISESPLVARANALSNVR
jgi:uncharacterized protein YndB with AHSA1/START domain